METMNTPTTDNDGAEKAPSPLMQHLRKVLADDSAFEAAKKEARVILEAARRINAASPVGQDALAAETEIIALALAEHHAIGWRGHARFVGEPEGMDAKTWANCNREMFMHEALEVAEKIEALASASHANPTSGGPGAGGVADLKARLFAILVPNLNAITGSLSDDTLVAMVQQRMDELTAERTANAPQGDAASRVIERAISLMDKDCPEEAYELLKQSAAQAPAPSIDAVEEAK